MLVAAESASARKVALGPLSRPAAPSTHGLSWSLAMKGSNAPALSALARQTRVPGSAACAA
jgi:hypothetical protein